MHIKLVGTQLSKLRQLLLAIFVLSVSGCAGSGQLVCPSEYQRVAPLPALPKDRMAPPQYQQRLSDEFFGPGQTPTTKSSGSNPN